MIYFDNAAAYRPEEKTADFHIGIWQRDFANQEALHKEAYRLRKALDDAGSELCRVLGVSEVCDKVLWFNSVTEIFIFLGDFFAGTRAWINPLEHPAVTANISEKCIFETLSCDAVGKVIVPESCEPSAGICFLHHVQSELGVIQDVSAFVKNNAFQSVIVDAAQSAGKIALAKEAHLTAVSGIKMGAPGGAALLINRTFRQTAKLLEFYQKLRTKMHRLPRVNVPDILTMVYAAGVLAGNMEKNFQQVSLLNRRLRQHCRKFDVLPTLADEVDVSPYILNLRLPGQQGAVVVRALSEKGICVASGSACAAESGAPSPALLALGFNKKDAYNALRVSFNAANSTDEVDFFASELEKVLKNY